MKILDIELNENNGAHLITRKYQTELLDLFPDEQLRGCEMGVAYGGGLANMRRIWGDRTDTIWGFDTYEGHPVEEMLTRCEASQRAGGKASMAAVCMEHWYNLKDRYGDRYTDEHIQAELDELGYDNVVLVKGLVTDATDVSFIEDLHYAFIDMDWPQAQRDGYELLKNKIKPGGYLALHDMCKRGHIPGCWEIYQDILAEGVFELVEERPDPQIVSVLRRL